MKASAEVEQIGDRLLVSSFGRTTDGLRIKDSPLTVPLTVTDAELGEQVHNRLAAFHTGIPRPTLDEMKAEDRDYYRARGFRSRRAYEESAAIAGIEQDGAAITVYPFRRIDAAGHGGVDELAVSLQSPSDEALGRTVRAALAQSGPEAPRWRPPAGHRDQRPRR